MVLRHAALQKCLCPSLSIGQYRDNPIRHFFCGTLLGPSCILLLPVQWHLSQRCGQASLPCIRRLLQLHRSQSPVRTRNFVQLKDV
jgi:hypothetical protein